MDIGGTNDVRPRVLVVSHDMLWPPVGGGRMRCEILVRHALREARVDLVVVAPADDVARHRDAVPDLPGLTTHVFVDESPPGPTPDRASRAAAAHIERLTGDGDPVDAVHVEGHYLVRLVPLRLHGRTILVDHNVESQLVAQRASTGEPVPDSRIREIERHEGWAWRQAGAVVALSPEDADEMHRREPTVVPHLIPNGWDHLPEAPPRPPDDGCLTAPRLLFVADYDYPPNRDALGWLVDEVFPLIQAGVPGARLRLVGVNVGAALARSVAERAGVDVVGYVDDLPAELDRADVVLCPLRIGGGVKVKVIEAIRRSCLLVSTTVGGIRGIPEPLRSAVCFADDATTFAGHVVRLCVDPAERRRRRAVLAANQWAAPTWEESSRRTIRLWSTTSARARRLS
ncbi:glycosyltransferase [Actinophytocola sp.]|uniref:glycosyltransferase n=1 Tax=Actinophytocola sp. TaxID=1872138 RepID=UPI002ED3BAC2